MLPDLVLTAHAYGRTKRVAYEHGTSNGTCMAFIGKSSAGEHRLHVPISVSTLVCTVAM